MHGQQNIKKSENAILFSLTQSNVYTLHKEKYLFFAPCTNVSLLSIAIHKSYKFP